MSGSFDRFAIKSGLVKEEDVREEYKIRLCKDRTISITKGKEKPFNGVAIAVLSLPTLEEAESLITFVGKLQWVNHPQMKGNKPWFKFMPDMEYGNIEYEDIPRLTEHLKFCLSLIRNRNVEEEGA